ncbi:hypothetical protein GCM10009716_44540 [Streptomyces sodiiphilus]|uniref:Phosphoribosyltransferase domain-containing protein n=1 Tax=Streptomyces sodiiphilus TaxID=226217 RepID=A0ABN2PUJ3_9ACTN
MEESTRGACWFPALEERGDGRQGGTVREWWREIGALVLPAVCAGCGAPPVVLCEHCRGELSGKPAREVRPVPAPAGLPPVYAAAHYADQPRAVLLAHKERGALPLAAALGDALANGVRAAAGASRGGPLWLVPVPSARSAVARRGHDAVRRMALAAAGRLRGEGVPCRVLPLLRQRRPVLDQAGLTAVQRLANLTGALEASVGGLPDDGVVVLVDDILTTGASLAEAARAVRAAGGRPAAAAVVAAVAAAPRGGRPGYPHRR